MTCARWLRVCAGALGEKLLKYSISLPLALLLSFRAHSLRFEVLSATSCLFSMFPVPFSIPSVYFALPPTVVRESFGRIARTFYLAKRVLKLPEERRSPADCWRKSDDLSAKDWWLTDWFFVSSAQSTAVETLIVSGRNVAFIKPTSKGLAHC